MLVMLCAFRYVVLIPVMLSLQVLRMATSSPTRVLSTSLGEALPRSAKLQRCGSLSSLG